jgi:cation diffusion facilitator CzcD-associated flavoprotein CzcO
VADRVGHLAVFQRTAAWVMPRLDRPVPESRRALYRRAPALQKLNRLGQYLPREAMVMVLAKRPALAGRLERIALGHLEKQVADPALRAALTPSFTLGCKRILLSNEWYPTLVRPDVDLVTSPIAAVEPKGVRTADGITHELDTIILATGFAVSPHPIARVIHGTGGHSLQAAWTHGMRAHLGMTVPGFPNLFTLMGPNTGLGHSSIVFMLEAQIDYVASALTQMDRYGIGAVSVRPAVADGFDREMQDRLDRSVWNSGGCGSWYLDAEGRNTTMWPGFTMEYRLRTRRFRLGEYLTTNATTP